MDDGSSSLASLRLFPETRGTETTSCGVGTAGACGTTSETSVDDESLGFFADGYCPENLRFLDEDSWMSSAAQRLLSWLRFELEAVGWDSGTEGDFGTVKASLKSLMIAVRTW